jgi:hypothetical protein
MRRAACYDLSLDIASSDFLSWLVMAKAEGVQEIVFRVDRGFLTNKWLRERVQRRLETMLMPSCAFLDLPYRIGTDGERMKFRPSAHDLQRYCINGGTFPRLKSVLPPGNAKYTVTLRRDYRIPEKNSNEPAWREFAVKIGAVVIEDYDVEPKHPHEIMALYAGAEMNFGVNGGQFWFCALSDYPYMVFDVCNLEAHTDTAHDGTITLYFPRYGVPIGKKWAWFGPHQHVIWESDRIEVLQKYFALWRNNEM